MFENYSIQSIIGEDIADETQFFQENAEKKQKQ